MQKLLEIHVFFLNFKWTESDNKHHLISLLQEIAKAVSGEVVSSSLNNDSLSTFESM